MKTDAATSEGWLFPKGDNVKRAWALVDQSDLRERAQRALRVGWRELRPAAVANYHGLRDHLATAAAGPVTMSFGRIDALVGGLPRSARTYRPWWGNHGGTHVQAVAWLAAGRTVAAVDLGSEQVTFSRRS